MRAFVRSALGACLWCTAHACTPSPSPPLRPPRPPHLPHALLLCPSQEEGQTKLEVTTKVDAGLVSGMTIEVGDKYLDYSVATQLKKLQQCALPLCPSVLPPPPPCPLASSLCAPQTPPQGTAHLLVDDGSRARLVCVCRAQAPQGWHVSECARLWPRTGCAATVAPHWMQRRLHTPFLMVYIAAQCSSGRRPVRRARSAAQCRVQCRRALPYYMHRHTHTAFVLASCDERDMPPAER